MNRNSIEWLDASDIQNPELWEAKEFVTQILARANAQGAALLGASVFSGGYDAVNENENHNGNHIRRIQEFLCLLDG